MVKSGDFPVEFHEGDGLKTPPAIKKQA